MALSLMDLLKTTIEKHGSDLHITVDTPPQIRVHGSLQRLNHPILKAADTKHLIYSVLTESQRKWFEETSELDFAFGIREIGRFRANVFMQRGTVAAAYRVISQQIRTFPELNLPAAVAGFADHPRGLVLVTGPTGSGKSTTLAALIDKINTERRQHILTIEDPIEFLHEHKNCIVNQREVHLDTQGFAQALRAAMREDPDVVLIGELRDLETTESALKLAETGHLTFATLHTNSASATISRVVDLFPAHQQDQIRIQLSLVLEGVVCQALLPRAGMPGRVLACEVLVPTPAIRNLIRENKMHQIYSAMQAGQEKLGMQTLNQSLASLYLSKQIALEDALAIAKPKEELQQMIDRGVGVVPGHARAGSRPYGPESYAIR